ncbi:rod-binding protein [Frigidibacter oleivorans]|uniref:rod-binding protein n=1 Tax=Frigidibacter oleivorans TaxID=2487129 RepID=UPI000F8D92D3|nr:rod-binding protein [Frigidibacter oleivorans]
MTPLPVAPPPSLPPPDADRRLRAAAEALEAVFLSEILGAAGFGAARDMLGGGSGEAQFASLWRDEQARALVRHGGIGLAESIFNALKTHTNVTKADP